MNTDQLHQISGVVSFEDLSKAISFDREKSEDLINGRLEFLSKQDDGNYIYDPSAHIKFFMSWVEKNQLEKHVNVVQNSEKMGLVELGEEVFPEYCVELVDLTIHVRTHLECLILDCLPSSKRTPADSNKSEDQHTGGLVLRFIRCHFVAGDPKKYCYFQAKAGADAILAFNNCVFEKVDMLLSSGGNYLSLIELRGNTFDNRHVTIGSARRLEVETGGYWTIDPDFAGRVLAAPSVERRLRGRRNANAKHKDLEKRLAEAPESISIYDVVGMFLEEQKLPSVSAEHLAPHGTKSIIRIDGNDFNTLKFGGLSHFYFTGRNEIKRMDLGELPPFVRWGQNQRLDRAKRYGHFHKEAFLRLKFLSDRRQDNQQSQIYRREIVRCENSIVAREPLRFSWQDKFILGFSNLVSAFGSSWMRPVCLMLLVNLLVTCVVQMTLSNLCVSPSTAFNTVMTDLFQREMIPAFPELCAPPVSQFLIFLEMLNPLSSIGDIVGTTHAFITFLDILQKLIFAALAYDIINTFRRFGRG